MLKGRKLLFVPANSPASLCNFSQITVTQMSAEQSDRNAQPAVVGSYFGRLHSLLDESARPWGVSARETRFMFWMPVFGTLFVLASCFHRPLFVFLLDEDGLGEWLQFALFCIATISGMVITVRLARSGSRFYAALFAMFALMMFFCAGEEISWGQRILGLETPESILESNKQKELNLHNVGNTLTYMRLVMLAGSAAGASAWLVNRKLRIERFIPRADELFIPPLFLSSVFLVMVVYRLFRYATPTLSNFTIVHLAEWPEFCFTFGLAAFSYLIARRLKSTPTSEA